MRRPIARLGLSPRIFVTIALVILAGAGTLLLVALWVAPQVFANHLAQAGLALDAAEQAHVEDGFTMPSSHRSSPGSARRCWSP